MMTDLWTLGRERLAAELPAQQFNTWIRPLPVPQVTVAEDGASTRVALRAPQDQELSQELRAIGDRSADRYG